MEYLLSTDILTNFIGPLCEPLEVWLDSVDPASVRISSLSYYWLSASIHVPEVASDTRIKYQLNLDRFRQLSIENYGFQELEIDTDVLERWRLIFHTGREHQIQTEELFVIATAVSRKACYISFSEDWLVEFGRKFELAYKIIARE